jgi:aconitate hydratase
MAPEVPARNFDHGNATYVAPPVDGSRVELKVNPNSERIQLMQPWPAWDGKDFMDMPVLMKTKGKTTTDHISPAGPWLRYRGHLDKFSDNMFMGATNAYTGEAGKGKNVMTGETGQSIAGNARYYKSKGVKWVVVGDSNYGEGSSREHAALSPRLLGGAAVIVRSFARIHESNLKKQGLLALTFPNPADYDRIREDDRISLVGLKAMAPGKPVECRVKHSDGTSETLHLNHSFSGPQLEWFRKGSALNLFHGGASAPAKKRSGARSSAAGRARKPAAKKKSKAVSRKTSQARKPAAKKKSKAVSRKVRARKPVAAKRRGRR